MEDKPKIKWYFRTSMLVIIFLCVGPLVLPLVWLHPTYSRKEKVITTIIIALVSYFLGVILINSLKSIAAYYKVVFQGSGLMQ